MKLQASQFSHANYAAPTKTYEGIWAINRFAKCSSNPQIYIHNLTLPCVTYETRVYGPYFIVNS